MLSALILGYVFPGYGERLAPLFKPCLLIILTLVFAKIDMADVLGHLRNPGLMGYLLVMQRLVLPLLAYVVVRPIDPELAIGVALLVAVPPAASSPVFTDILGGSTALCVSIYLVAYLTAPVTVTLVMGAAAGKAVNLWGLFGAVLVLIFVPMGLAQAGRRWCRAWIDRNQHHFSGVNLLVATFLIFAIVSSQAVQFRADPVRIGWVVAGLYVLFAGLHGIGYVLIWWRPDPDRLAVSISTAYMNTALAVVLAYQFFADALPAVVLVAVASEVPWSTVLGPFKWVHRRWLMPRG